MSFSRGGYLRKCPEVLIFLNAKSVLSLCNQASQRNRAEKNDSMGLGWHAAPLLSIDHTGYGHHAPTVGYLSLKTPHMYFYRMIPS
jgi:hypothetical protein